MTLEEWFASEQIDLDFLVVQADESEYWQKCEQFVRQNWKRDADSLSPKQSDWASRILDDCVEIRIEGRR